MNCRLTCHLCEPPLHPQLALLHRSRLAVMQVELEDPPAPDAEAGVVATSTGCRGAVVKMPEFSPYKGVQDDLEAWRSETASSVGAGMSMLVIG